MLIVMLISRYGVSIPLTVPAAEDMCPALALYCHLTPKEWFCIHFPPISLIYCSQSRADKNYYGKRRETQCAIIIDYARTTDIEMLLDIFLPSDLDLSQPKNYHEERIENLCMTLLLIMQDYAIYQNVVDNAQLRKKMIVHAKSRWSHTFWYY